MKAKSQTFRLRVKGPRACFTRPEAKVERMSYEVITPSAVRGVLEAILWHAGITWVTERIFILNPIQFYQIKRNEVDEICKLGANLHKFYIEDHRTQRNTIFLTDVDYVIDAHFVLDTALTNASDNYTKFEQMMFRRLEKGQHFHQPYLGCREFVAHVEPAPDTWGVPLEFIYRDMGLMLKDFDYSGDTVQPIMFHAVVKNGCIEIPVGSEV